VFTVDVMVDGQRLHRVIGRESDGTTRTQAETFIEKVRRDAREGRLQIHLVPFFGDTPLSQISTFDVEWNGIIRVG
jgi:hypothetical protein